MSSQTISHRKIFCQKVPMCARWLRQHSASLRFGTATQARALHPPRARARVNTNINNKLQFEWDLWIKRILFVKFFLKLYCEYTDCEYSEKNNHNYAEIFTIIKAPEKVGGSAVLLNRSGNRCVFLCSENFPGFLSETI